MVQLTSVAVAALLAGPAVAAPFHVPYVHFEFSISWIIGSQVHYHLAIAEHAGHAHIPEAHPECLAPWSEGPAGALLRCFRDPPLLDGWWRSTSVISSYLSCLASFVSLCMPDRLWGW
ncbi:hypothetical protein NLJ89_g5984 [Agrocybe chaxingu]|uniref:Uncharacterized protein n=1 Tax=Agrocybe chaxingu TaxID=84603 RepID=A0A9W8JZJ6_9AGAR|nr:hypothetical protein NLJ89_g5984 [Agrocybe chaxingu]